MATKQVIKSVRLRINEPKVRKGRESSKGQSSFSFPSLLFCTSSNYIDETTNSKYNRLIINTIQEYKLTRTALNYIRRLFVGLLSFLPYKDSTQYLLIVSIGAYLMIEIDIPRSCVAS